MASDPTFQQPRLPWATWLGRGVAGFFLGLLWDSLVTLLWVGAATLISGGFDRALEEMKPSRWVAMFVASYSASAHASLVASTFAPLTLRASPHIPRPVLCSSACGGALGAMLGVCAGLAI